MKLKSFMTNFVKKLGKLSLIDWITISMWLVTFIFLIVTIIISTMSDNFSTKTQYANTIAGVVLAFSVCLIASLLFIVIVRYLKNKKTK